MHLALLGDSILDNGAYVSGGSDVATHLGELLPEGASVTLLARDGARVESVFSQIFRIPSEATHLILSVGGNDALGAADVLKQTVQSVGEALDYLAEIIERFQRSYRELTEQVIATGRSVAVCTIYYPAFESPTFQVRAVAALAHFNDVIIFEASRLQVPVLDLRQVCTDATDYANPIEPSHAGGRRIAEAIVRMLGEHEFSTNSCRIYS